jgi:hypothetical protein
MQEVTASSLSPSAITDGASIGVFQIPVRIRRTCHVTSRTWPTLTDVTRAFVSAVVLTMRSSLLQCTPELRPAAWDVMK